MADIADGTRIYRRLALNKAGSALASQLIWLNTTFMIRAEGADAGGFQPGSSSFEGGSFSGLFRGLSEEDRAVALLNAIEEIESAIAAAADDTVAPAPTAVLLPRIITSPR